MKLFITTLTKLNLKKIIKTKLLIPLTHTLRQVFPLIFVTPRLIISLF